MGWYKKKRREGYHNEFLGDRELLITIKLTKSLQVITKMDVNINGLLVLGCVSDEMKVSTRRSASIVGSAFPFDEIYLQPMHVHIARSLGMQ